MHKFPDSSSNYRNLDLLPNYSCKINAYNKIFAWVLFCLIILTQYEIRYEGTYTFFLYRLQYPQDNIKAKAATKVSVINMPRIIQHHSVSPTTMKSVINFNVLEHSAG